MWSSADRGVVDEPFTELSWIPCIQQRRARFLHVIFHGNSEDKNLKLFSFMAIILPKMDRWKIPSHVTGVEKLRRGTVDSFPSFQTHHVAQSWRNHRFGHCRPCCLKHSVVCASGMQKNASSDERPSVRELSFFLLATTANSIQHKRGDGNGFHGRRRAAETCHITHGLCDTIGDGPGNK
jgi:hypothetical protein